MACRFAASAACKWFVMLSAAASWAAANAACESSLNWACCMSKRDCISTLFIDSSNRAVCNAMFAFIFASWISCCICRTRTSASVESADTELIGPRVGAYAAAATADDDDTTSSDTTSSASIESALAAIGLTCSDKLGAPWCDRPLSRVAIFSELNSRNAIIRLRPLANRRKFSAAILNVTRLSSFATWFRSSVSTSNDMSRTRTWSADSPAGRAPLGTPES